MSDKNNFIAEFIIKIQILNILIFYKKYFYLFIHTYLVSVYFSVFQTQNYAVLMENCN